MQVPSLGNSLIHFASIAHLMSVASFMVAPQPSTSGNLSVRSQLPVRRIFSLHFHLSIHCSRFMCRILLVSLSYVVSARLGPDAVYRLANGGVGEFNRLFISIMSLTDSYTYNGLFFMYQSAETAVYHNRQRRERPLANNTRQSLVTSTQSSPPQPSRSPVTIIRDRIDRGTRFYVLLCVIHSNCFHMSAFHSCHQVDWANPLSLLLPLQCRILYCHVLQMQVHSALSCQCDGPCFHIIHLSLTGISSLASPDPQILVPSSSDVAAQFSGSSHQPAQPSVIYAYVFTVG